MTIKEEKFFFYSFSVNIQSSTFLPVIARSSESLQDDVAISDGD